MQLHAPYRKEKLNNLFKEGLLCQKCGYRKDWRVLLIHHKNKNRQDNRKENLQLLCANCHLIVHFKKWEREHAKTKPDKN